VLWTFIWDNYLHLLTASIGISSVVAFFVYFKSFTVEPGKPGYRELAAGGHSGNPIYDWFIGRELNPRVTLPVLGTIDLKVFFELRPGMLGWVLLDLAFIAHQYKTYGYITDSIILVTLFQSIYVFDALWMESAILTTMDVTTDGFGFMLAFGDLVWVPFIYSLQAKYLAVYPLQLGPKGTLGVVATQGLGYFIFRGANNQKNRFRTNPEDPRVSHLKYIETRSGSRLLVTGWWGKARHINYLGDWIMGWTYCLPTGIAGYVIQHASDGRHVVQGDARGWGMIVTYFYIVYFAILLIHREMRDEEKCKQKYGDDWKEYQRRVRWRIVPGIY
jgi:delta14-sterol reductase